MKKNRDLGCYNCKKIVQTYKKDLFLCTYGDNKEGEYLPTKLNEWCCYHTPAILRSS